MHPSVRNTEMEEMSDGVLGHVGEANVVTVIPVMENLGEPVSHLVTIKWEGVTPIEAAHGLAAVQALVPKLAEFSV